MVSSVDITAATENTVNTTAMETITANMMVI